MPVTLTFHVLSWGPDPATGGSDFFEMTDAKKTVPAGQSETTVTALVYGDQLVEPDEHVILFIHDVSTCTSLSGGVEIAFGIIVDDDLQLAVLDLLADLPFAGGPDDPVDPHDPADPSDPADGDDPGEPGEDPEPTDPTPGGDDPQPSEPTDDNAEEAQAGGSSTTRGVLPCR